MNTNTAHNTKDARAEARKILRCHAKILLKKAPPLTARTVDIAMNGLSMMAPEHIAPGQLCGIAFETPVNGKVLEVKVVAKIVYSICVGTAGFRVGVQFTDVDPASKTALNQIMR